MRVLTAVNVAACAFFAVASSQGQISGTAETYFSSDITLHGFVHAFSWVEVNDRFTPRLKGTFSLTEGRTRRTLDEVCVSYEAGDWLVRGGRIRTAFGFSNWSELFYNGFNHLPFLRTLRLADGVSLTRDDAGIEVTTGGPEMQVQAALIDNELSTFQVGPEKLRHGTLRLQRQQGPVILGLDALQGFEANGDIYGVDLRWTTPRVIFRAEYMRGVGHGNTTSGYYADVSYRIPHLPRTQAVARTEWTDLGSPGTFELNTLGLRQFVTPNLSANVNYGWDSGKTPSFVANSGSIGWSIRGLFQVFF